MIFGKVWWSIWASVIGITMVTSGCSGEPDKEYTTTYPLRAMNLNSVTTERGDFFLIAGSYSKDEKQRYFFYVDNPDGTTALHDNEVNDVILRLTSDGSEPRIECADERKPQRLAYAGYAMLEKCTFFVPEESVGNNFNLNKKASK